jgi:hypothetical protein
MKALAWAGLFTLSICGSVEACIWDSKTLEDEKKKDPTLAEAILSPQAEIPDLISLSNKIQQLRAAPMENDPAWWNDLAGTYLRMGQPAEAVKILELLTNRFAGDYGVHANLGTAYHLLGRYTDAEREIARDLEINPDAHFGLEKYHLALLQYLIRDEDYRSRHVYVDEFTPSFLETAGFRTWEPEEGSYLHPPMSWDETVRKGEADWWRHRLGMNEPLSKDELVKVGTSLAELAANDEQPKYRVGWNLAKDPHLEKGVIYMASLNTRQPACWVMLGMLAVKQTDKNLTIAAFEKAIQLGSSQRVILQGQVNELRAHIAEAQQMQWESRLLPFLGLGLAAGVCAAAIFLLRKLTALFARR